MPSFARNRLGSLQIIRKMNFTTLRQRLRSQIVRNIGWLLRGQLFQLAGRFGYFIIIAHALGPREYGSFIACTALVSIISPYASFGTGHVMIKEAAREPASLSAYFGNALVVTLISGSALMALLLIFRAIVLPSSVTVAMLLAIGIGDLLAAEMTAVCLQVFLVLEEGRLYSHLLVSSTMCRVFAAVILAFSAHTAGQWALLYSGSSLVGLGLALTLVMRRATRPTVVVGSVPRSIREGFHFATSLASQSVYNDIDKTMLARLSTMEATAIYAIAYRFIEPALVPIRAAASASYPAFFRHGNGGIRSAVKFARSILPHSMLYGTLTAVFLYCVAGLIPAVFGASYAESTMALRWLCALPFLKCIHIFLSDVLTGCDYQWQTSSAQICVAVLNAIANLWVIRMFAWRGAAWTSLGTDALLIVILAVIILCHMRRENPISADSLAAPALQARD